MKEIHESFKYSNSGLGPASQLIIAIVMATFVGPMAMEALTVSMGTVGAAGLAAVATGAATNATTSFINNGGNLGAVFKDVTSKDALKSYAIAAVTAAMTQGYFGDLTGTTTDSITGKIVFSDPSVTLGSLEGIGRFAANQALQNGTATALSKIMGQGGNQGDALKTTLYNTLAAASFNAVGDYTKDLYSDGSLQKIAIHAIVDGLLSQVSGGDFKSGALAGGANEAMVDQLYTWVGGDQNLLNMSSQLVGMLAAATLKSADAESLQKGAWVAENATQYNHDNHLTSTQEVDRDLRDELGLPMSPAEQAAMGDVSLHIGLPPPGVSGILGGAGKGGGKETGSISAGPKVPPKLQPLSNPPQGPVIPADWISRPGKTPGSTIYYPPGSEPSAPGSTYIRLMPSGSTPVPGLENGYWISVKNGQPINPATGGTGTRGDTHVPLPINTVPPNR